MFHSGTALIDPYKIFARISLSEGKRVADLGCGRTGHFVFPAVKIVGEKGVVYAVDVVKNILDSIKSTARTGGHDNVQTVWSDIEVFGKTPIPDNSLDACFCINVLFQLKNKAGAIKEAARMLKPGGYLVVVDWAKKLGGLGPSPESMLKPEDLLKLAAQENLKFVDKILPGEYHYSLIFEKT
ncbi:MAG TPA: methyltransferase domain-containing protein [Candidatus Udaeobacter sp.]|nr:methyltransferase domain-containing protein [Candidatus Udaeobacter sp.]